MCRFRSSFVGQMILGALAALVVGGCGKGLYTNGVLVRPPDGSGGGVTVPESATGSGFGGTGGTATSDNRGSTGGTSGTSSDVRFDAGSSATVTKPGSYDTETEFRLGDAYLVIPKRTLPLGGPYSITLSLESSDGTMPNYGGAIGPIYSITVPEGVELWNSSAVLRIRVPADLGIPPQRMGMAYLDEESKGWIAIQSSDKTYDSGSGEVIGTVFWFTGKRFFAPFETCTKAGQDGGTCRSPLSCLGEACQK